MIQSKERPFIDHLFLGLESFCNQCGNDEIQNISLRLLCILVRAIAIIVISLYGATITSFFAVDIFRPPFTNMEGFLANGDYRIILCQMTLHSPDNFKFLVSVNTMAFSWSYTSVLKHFLFCRFYMKRRFKTKFPKVILQNFLRQTT